MKDPFFYPPEFLVTALRPLGAKLTLPVLALHAHEVLIGFATYQAMDRYISPAVSRAMYPKKYDSLDPRTLINWNMRVTSFIQAVFVTGLALWVKWNDDDVASMAWESRLWGYSGGIGMVQGFAAGYFLWDLTVCLLHYELLGPETLAHALSALLLILLAFRPFMHHYGLNLILYEISTPFLNIHWFLDKCNMTGSIAQLINGVVLISSFVLSRLVWGSYNIFWMAADVWTALRSDNIDMSYARGSNWNFETVGVLGKQMDHDPLPAWIVGIFLGANLLLWCLNVFWIGQMTKAMRKRFRPQQNAQKKQK